VTIVRRRILIVDDDPGVRSLFKAILCDEESLCATFASAEEALEAMAADRFDLAIVDLRLPGKSGAELAWEMRKSNCSLPIIAVSAYLSQWDRDDLEDLGIDRVLAKPFTPEALRKVVSEAIAARGGAQSNAHL
jgi:DNA-binding response OmpR family regulator